MAACTLDVGSRRVLVSEEGPPAAEFALFDTGDIELAPGDGGVLRETGYRTTAAAAGRRLAVLGVTLDFALECAALVRGRIAEAYARGPLVQRLAVLMGPAELFDGGTYDSALRRYDGTWLDLPLLANDAGIASATAGLHAAALAALLDEVPSDTPVVLTTLGHAESLRLGERTVRRQAVDNVASIPRALRRLAEHAVAAPPQPVGRGPGREAFAQMVTARLAECTSGGGREHLARLERALSERGRPASGPLSDPAIWEIERLLGAGDTANAKRLLDAHEAGRGREPGTVYLRARLSLTLGVEMPRAIALRAAEMASSMSDFHEVELLAAQAWNAAGETRSALPFARELAANPRAPDDLRAAAEAIFRAPRVPLEAPMGLRDFESHDGDLRSISHQAPPPSDLSRRPSERPRPPTSERPRPYSQPPPMMGEPSIRNAIPPEASPIARSVPPPPVVVHDSRADSSLPTPPSEPPPAGQRRTLTPPGVAPPPRSVPPVAVKESRRYLTPPERMASPLPPRISSSAEYRAVRGVEVPPPARKPPSKPPTKPPPSAPVTPRSPGTVPPSEPRRSTAPPPPLRPSASGRVVQAVPWPTALRAPREDLARPEDVEHTPARSVSQRFMRGASMPPSMTEPPARIPRAPVVPRVDIDEAELIETLPLPRGASEVGFDTNASPRSPLEARIRFTLESRELARRYRREDGIELRLEPRALHAMQRRLSQVFVRRIVTTPEEAREAELHGALLSELLARLVDAEWVDVAPTELGYWAMVVPTATATKEAGGKRVWPFGRVLRFIAGGDDDLVAFFKKLREL